MTESDVIIIGSGLAGGMLGAILARRGLSVTMLEASAHPRFAIGESVVPEFGARARIMADLFEVPELAHLSTFSDVIHHISAASGIKRSFTFAWHADGEVHRGRHTTQFRTFPSPLGPDTHLYRSDVDNWMTSVAIRYGVQYRERARVSDVGVDSDGVEVAAAGETFRGRFLVDGSGHRSVLAQKMGLRLDDPGTATDTRTIFNHFVGVGQFAQSRPAADRLNAPSPVDQATLHHLFDGGWFWVIPFDNHNSSVNPLCSVGLTLDRRRFPETGRPAAEEFQEFVDRLPSFASQMRNAKPVRSWVSTPRLQYASSPLAGDRWCLLPHSAGFIDALYSNGLTLALVGVQSVARSVLQSFAEDRFTVDRFAQLQSEMQDNLRAADQLVHGSLVCFRSFALFNAWFRFWAVSNFHGTAGLVSLHSRFQRTGDRAILERVFEQPFRLPLAQDQPRVREMVDQGYRVIQRLDSGAITEEQAVSDLFVLLRGQDWIPAQFRIGDPKCTALSSFTAFPLMRLMSWGKRKAPADMRELYYATSPMYFWELTKAIGREAWRGVVSCLKVARDAHYSRGRS